VVVWVDGLPLSGIDVVLPIKPPGSFNGNSIFGDMQAFAFEADKTGYVPLMKQKRAVATLTVVWSTTWLLMPC
jgi:hypothetical protein